TSGRTCTRRRSGCSGASPMPNAGPSPPRSRRCWSTSASTRSDMAERSFKAQVEDLMLGEGETFTGAGTSTRTKALCESGVGYDGAYQGSPSSHLRDALADAEELLAELGVRYEANANEAAAAAMLAASVHYPIRGAVTFKGPVGV